MNSPVSRWPASCGYVSPLWSPKISPSNGEPVERCAYCVAMLSLPKPPVTAATYDERSYVPYDVEKRVIHCFVGSSVR